MMKKLFVFGLLLFSVIIMAQFNNVNNQIRMNQQQQQQVQIMNNQFRMMNQQQQFMHRMMQNMQAQKVSLQNLQLMYQGNTQKLENDKKEIESQIDEKRAQLRNFDGATDTKSQQKIQREIDKLLKKTAKIDSKINKNNGQLVYLESKIAENQKKQEEASKKKADKELQKTK